MRRIAKALVLLGLSVPAFAGHKGGGAPDRDGDAIPDARDPFPDDRERPGKARPNTVYAHSSSTLFLVDPEQGTPTAVAEFSFSDGQARQVTDIAIDPWGVTWAVAFGTFMTCHPGTARCEVLRELPASFNALTVLEPEGDAPVRLFGVTTDGRWFRWTQGSVPVELGRHGANSSGDAYREGTRVRASRDGPAGRDELIELDPDDAGSVRVLAALDGQEMYGFAACSDRVFGFDASGAIYRGHRRGRGTQPRPLTDARVQWWGAACSGPARMIAADSESAPTPATVQRSEPAPASGRGEPVADGEDGGGGCSCL